MYQIIWKKVQIFTTCNRNVVFHVSARRPRYDDECKIPSQIDIEFPTGDFERLNRKCLKTSFQRRASIWALQRWSGKLFHWHYDKCKIVSENCFKICSATSETRERDGGGRFVDTDTNLQTEECLKQCMCFRCCCAKDLLINLFTAEVNT